MVSINTEFIEEWNARYRSLAENTRWRIGPLNLILGGDQMLSQMAEFKTAWHLEEFIFTELLYDIQSRGSLTKPEFITIARWKTPRQLGRYEANSNDEIKTKTQAAFEPGIETQARVAALSDLHGVKTAVASALLTAWRPDDFTIIDIWALSTLSNFDEEVDGEPFRLHKQPYWEARYDSYVRACRAISERCGQPLRQVDRALWQWGQVNGEPD